MGRQRKRIVVVGGAGVDYSVKGSALPTSSRPMTGDEFLRDVGGKGANQAIAAARLGGDATLIACVGGDPEADEVLAALRQDHVATRGIVRDHAQPTACTLICVDAQGRKLTASRPGANRSLTIDKISHDCLTGAEVMLVQLEIPLETVIALARAASDAGTRVVLDASPVRDVPDDLLQLAHVVAVNDAEAEVLAQMEVRDRETAMTAAERICRRGARSVTIGLDDGRVIISDDARHWLAHPRVSVVDTTGAGDACAGGIAVALAEDRSVIDACGFGHAAAALATTQFGARRSLPSREALEALRASRRRSAH